ncbi:MAG: aminotransferase class III-fold pyridoxal phosphate-dependent enzyme [Ilumatobacteraceae bacterium]
MIPGSVRARLSQVRSEEDGRFVERTSQSDALAHRARELMPNGVPMAWMAGLYRHLPPWVTHGVGANFFDADGNEYVDFNLCDLSTPAGFTPEPVVRAIIEQAGRGLQFLLPVEDAIDAGHMLARRFGLGHWQFTLSASTANIEAIRLARAHTGRTRIVVLAGGYHGHIDDTLEPIMRGLPPRPADWSTEVAFNDAAGVSAELAHGDVAAVILEPALTNCGVVLPAPGFLDEVRTACTANGALMIVDETHTQMAMHGGLTHRMSLEPDVVTAGKGIGGGVPIGVYGMTAELARTMEAALDVDIADEHGVATGGTLFANPLSLAAARAGLSEIFTEDRHAGVEALGNAISDGIDRITAEVGLPWRAHRLGARSGWCLEPELPADAAAAQTSLDPLFTDTRKVYFANRGVWDAIASAGPHAGFAHTAADVGRYLEVAADFVRAITR